jgi:hypothetical protein
MKIFFYKLIKGNTWLDLQSIFSTIFQIFCHKNMFLTSEKLFELECHIFLYLCCITHSNEVGIWKKKW